MKPALLRIAALLAGAAVLPACSSAGPAPTNVAFDRPGRFALACFDVSTSPPEAHPLAYCNPNPTDGMFNPNHDLHAIVLQTARGQLGLVDVQPAATAALIDSNPTVPGYTFLAIGEQPVDIVASDGKNGAPLTTYIAHRGSRDLWWIGTGELRRVATTLPWHTLALDAEPTSIVLSPNEDFLFVALRDLGVVRQFHVTASGDLESPTDVLLSSAIPAPVTLPVGTDVSPWQHVCAPVVPPAPLAVAPRADRLDGPAPTPSRIILQQRDMTTPGDALIVADSSLPVLHVIPLGATGLDAAGMHRFDVGSPTSDIAITPSVPASTLGTNLINRYVYALDDRGDVIAVDWTDPSTGATTQGMVLPIGLPTGRSADRITFGTPASTLAVVTPQFPGNATVATPSCALTGGVKDAVPVGPVFGPTHLRGVFLAVGLFDGTVRAVDVWDADAFCRGAPADPGGADAVECAVAAGSDPTDATVFIRRHRPRVGSLVTTAATVTAAPSFTVAGVAGGVDSTGSAGSGLPSLVKVGDASGTGASCTDVGMAGAATVLGAGFPADDTLPASDALICVGVDPWSTLTQSYSVTYEGALYGNENGRFSADGSQFFASGVDFCAATVLGSAEAAGTTDRDFANGLGDQLVITGPPPSNDADPHACDAYQGMPAAAFAILHSYPDGHLDLGPELDPVSGEPNGRTDAATCFTQLIAFEVRSRQTWTVYAGASGLLSHVRHGATDADPCTLDASAGLIGLQSRATTGELFVNREVAFTIGNDTAPLQGSTLTFGVGGQPGSLAVAAGALPVAIQFSPTDQNMFVVDPLTNGLTHVLLDGYTVDVHYSNQ